MGSKQTKNTTDVSTPTEQTAIPTLNTAIPQKNNTAPTKQAPDFPPLHTRALNPAIPIDPTFKANLQGSGAYLVKEALSLIEKHSLAPAMKRSQEWGYRKYKEFFQKNQKDFEDLGYTQLPVCSDVWKAFLIVQRDNGHKFSTTLTMLNAAGQYIEQLGYPNPNKEFKSEMEKAKKAMLRDWGNDEERAKPILLSELEKLCNGLDLRTRQGCRADAYLKVMFYTGLRHDSFKAVRLSDLLFSCIPSATSVCGYQILTTWIIRKVKHKGIISLIFAY
jgi:hypothetical protein